MRNWPVARAESRTFQLRIMPSRSREPPAASLHVTTERFKNGGFQAAASVVRTAPSDL